MTGTPNQIEWAEQIRSRVAADFDRVAKALEGAAGNQIERTRMKIGSMIEILDDKRAEVVAKDEAGYFIVEWQELGDRVRRLIMQDPRYQAINAHSTAQISHLKEGKHENQTLVRSHCSEADRGTGNPANALQLQNLLLRHPEEWQ